MVLAAALTLAACARESLVPDAGRDGPPVELSFDVGVLGALTKADTPEPTVFDNAGGTFQLYVAAYDKADGTLHASSLIGGEGFQPVGTMTDGVASVHLSLPRKQEYRIVFFAQREGAYTTFFKNNIAQFGVAQTNTANDASKDAFYTTVDVTAAKTSYDVTLKRPFAQVNVLVPVDNVPDGQTTFRSSMSVKMPIIFDLYSGKASQTEAEVTFTANTIAAESFGKYADTHKWVGMNYVLVPESGKVEVKSFLETGMKAAVAPGLVPVRMNGRTNLVGNLYGLDLSFAVVVEAGFGDETSLDPTVNPILNRQGVGCFFSGAERAYVAGTDQFVREYDGHALTFVLLDPEAGEQLVISGYSDTMAKDDEATMSVFWRKGTSTLLERSAQMSVLKDEDGLVWIADDEGNGFVIKK